MKKLFTIIAMTMLSSLLHAQDTATAPNKENGFTYVDLGLPSGTLWAARNVGSTHVTRYGNYFAWGETKAKSDYTWATYKYTSDKTAKGIDKYQWADNVSGTKWYNGKTFTGDNNIQLDIDDDAAHAIMGGKWHLPSSEQFNELMDNTTHTWVKDFRNSGNSGVIFQSKINKKAIFFPAAGNKNGMEFVDEGTMGFYWTSDMKGTKVTTVTMAETADVCAFCVYDGGTYFEYEPRCNGLSIRAVCGQK